MVVEMSESEWERLYAQLPEKTKKKVNVDVDIEDKEDKPKTSTHTVSEYNTKKHKVTPEEAKEIAEEAALKQARKELKAEEEEERKNPKPKEAEPEEEEKPRKKVVTNSNRIDAASITRPPRGVRRAPMDDGPLLHPIRFNRQTKQFLIPRIRTAADNLYGGLGATFGSIGKELGAGRTFSYTPYGYPGAAMEAQGTSAPTRRYAPQTSLAPAMSWAGSLGLGRSQSPKKKQSRRKKR